MAVPGVGAGVLRGLQQRMRGPGGLPCRVCRGNLDEVVALCTRCLSTFHRECLENRGACPGRECQEAGPGAGRAMVVVDLRAPAGGPRLPVSPAIGVLAVVLGLVGLGLHMRLHEARSLRELQYFVTLRWVAFGLRAEDLVAVNSPTIRAALRFGDEELKSAAFRTVRRHRLGSIYDKELLDLARTARGPFLEETWDAIQQQVARSDRDLVEALIGGVGDGSLPEPDRIGRLLRRLPWRSQDAFLPLVALLDHPGETVRRWAAGLLGDLAWHGLPRTIEKAYADEPQVAGALLRALGSSDPALHRAATEAMGILGFDGTAGGVVPVLEEMIRAGDERAGRAGKALESLRRGEKLARSSSPWDPPEVAPCWRSGPDARSRISASWSQLGHDSSRGDRHLGAVYLDASPGSAVAISIAFYLPVEFVVLRGRHADMTETFDPDLRGRPILARSDAPRCCHAMAWTATEPVTLVVFRDRPWGQDQPQEGQPLRQLWITGCILPPDPGSTGV